MPRYFFVSDNVLANDYDNNGNGNGDNSRVNDVEGTFLRRLEHSFNVQEREFQKTRDDVNYLKNQQNVIQRDIGTLTTTVQALMSKMDERAKPNLPAIALAVSMFIAVIPGMWFVMTTYVGSALSPIATTTGINATDIKHATDSLRVVEGQAIASQASDANSRTDRQQLNDRVRMLETSVGTEIADRRSVSASTKVALAEIETQLRSVCNTDNLRAAQQERINSIMYEKTFRGDRYPNGTFFSPCIARTGGSSLEP